MGNKREAKSGRKQAHKMGAISVCWAQQAAGTGSNGKRPEECQIITRWCHDGVWRQDKPRRAIAEEPNRLVCGKWQSEDGRLIATFFKSIKVEEEDGLKPRRVLRKRWKRNANCYTLIQHLRHAIPFSIMPLIQESNQKSTKNLSKDAVATLLGN